eukprot:CFRG5706T1
MPCPWITIDYQPIDWDAFASQEKVCILLNHTSFLDTAVFVSMMPPHILHKYKTLMMSTLFNIPLLGAISGWVGHYPVHFIYSNSEVVDKELQRPVMEAVHEFVSKGGCLCIFPEGAITRRPYRLRKFQYGAIKLAESHEMSYVLWSHVGPDRAWPVRCLLGGYPASIKLSVRPINVHCRASTDHELPNVGNTIRTKELTDILKILRNELQRDIDALL